MDAKIYQSPTQTKQPCFQSKFIWLDTHSRVCLLWRFSEATNSKPPWSDIMFSWPKKIVTISHDWLTHLQYRYPVQRWSTQKWWRSTRRCIIYHISQAQNLKGDPPHHRPPSYSIPSSIMKISTLLIIYFLVPITLFLHQIRVTCWNKRSKLTFLAIKATAVALAEGSAWFYQ
jgi:hypothetical protein